MDPAKASDKRTVQNFRYKVLRKLKKIKLAMKRLYLIVVGLFLLGPGARAQESIPTLDLTQPVSCGGEKLTTISGIVEGVGGGSPHGPPPPRLPLDLRLVDIEPRPLREGGQGHLRGRVRECGSRPVPEFPGARNATCCGGADFTVWFGMIRTRCQLGCH